MSDEPGDVLERLMPADEQAGDDRAATRVGAQVGFDAAVLAACLTSLAIACRSTRPPEGVVNTRLTSSPS